jgi:hypothetical protein
VPQIGFVVALPKVDDKHHLRRKKSMVRRVPYVILTVVAILLLASLAGSALAAEEGTKQVGLVIAFPDGTEHLEVVTVPANATTFDALKAADIDLASTESDFGPAVCGVNKVGCPADNCFCDAQHFWAYYHLDPAGKAWQASAQGVGAYVPPDSAVEGLAWSGMDASFMPVDQPKVRTFQDLSGAAPQSLPATGFGALPLALAAGLSLVAIGLSGRALFGGRSREN